MKNIIAHFVKFANEHVDAIPDYVAGASVHTFANLDNPRNESEVFLSAFAKQAGVQTAISKPELRKRARILGIEHQIDAMERAFNAPPEQVKTAAEEEYPIRSADEWKKAASWIEKNGYALSVDERRVVADKIVKKASEYNQEPSVSIEAMAGLGKFNAAAVVADLRKRAYLLRMTSVPNPVYRGRWIKAASSMDDLAEVVEEEPCTSEQYADKIAEAVQCVDNDFELYRYYGDRLKEPDLMVRSMSDKVAREINTYAVKLADGSVYDRRDFYNLNVGKIAKYFGSDTAWSMMSDLRVDVNKVASAVETWDLPEVEVLQSVFEEQGIVPKLKVAKALLGREFIESLAYYE
jgi:hypothetical protein